MKKVLASFLEYTSLGYDCYFTVLFGKDAISMKKRYSHKKGGPVYCEQYSEHKHAKDFLRIEAVLSFMYKNIQEQEESGEYYEPIDI